MSVPPLAVFDRIISDRGSVYAVSGGGGAGAASFGRVGRSIQTDAPGETASVTVTVDALSGVWMPTVGYLTTLGFTGDDANTQNANLHYNGATGTAIDIAGVHPGDTYAFTAKVAAPPSEQQLAEATVANVTTPRPDRVPDALGTVLASAVGDAKTPVEQIRAVETYFSKNGFFSNGLAGQAVSRAGHSLSRENDLLSAKQMIGDDEQYAVVMALALSQLGIPSRVVMGFVPSASTAASGPVSITGADVHAWVEVPFNDLGWVSFSPTPPKEVSPRIQAMTVVTAAITARSRSRVGPIVGSGAPSPPVPDPFGVVTADHPLPSRPA